MSGGSYGKIDSSGGFSWLQTINHASEDYNSYTIWGGITAIDETTIFITATIGLSGGDNSLYVAKINGETGATIWSFEWLETDYFSAFGEDLILDTANEYLYVIGNAYRQGLEDIDVDGVLLKINVESGDLVWDTTFGGSFKNEYFTAGTLFEDYLIVVGCSEDTDIYEGERDFLFLRWNLDGFLVWNKVYGLLASNELFNDVIPAIQEEYVYAIGTRDGGIYFAQIETEVGNIMSEKRISPHQQAVYGISGAFSSIGDLIIIGSYFNPLSISDTDIFLYCFSGSHEEYRFVANDFDNSISSEFGNIDEAYTLGMYVTNDNGLLLYGSNSLIFEINDNDFDSMNDKWEGLFGLDPSNYSDAFEDMDSDTLTNLQEFQAGSSPISNDTDGDLLFDNYEFFYGLKINTSDSSEDLDRDGLANYQEMLLGTFPNNRDTDQDKLPDGWEVQYGLNPLDREDAEDDEDADGLSNYVEYQYGCSPLDQDSDSDTLLDYYEIINLNTNPASNDTDNDRLVDNQELYVYHTNPRYWDSDNDNLGDGDEVLTYRSDPNVKDTDNDTIFDGIEVFYYLTNPTMSDSDSDGLTDNEEIFVYFTNPNLADSDHDGLDDKLEIMLGLNPNDPQSDLYGRVVIPISLFVIFVTLAAYNIKKRR